MAKKEFVQKTGSLQKRMRTRHLIYVGAFGAIYLVLMLIIATASSMVSPILYLGHHSGGRDMRHHVAR